MKLPPLHVREQRIAVFGESGSGKTVLLSSFYGGTQERAFIKSGPYKLSAETPSQGARLYQNYVGMRDHEALPETTRFRPETFTFSVTPQPDGAAKKTNTPFDAIELEWFDYPGEWFEEDTSDRTEAMHKTETFRNLLQSDVAFLLVDGRRLLDHRGEEHKYLKSLFHNYRTGLAALQQTLMPDGKPLEKFPRIWVLALSKTDVFDGLDVHDFKALVYGSAGPDLQSLADQITSFFEDPRALSIGEDFLLLSSANFEPGKIDVDTRVGVDLILPLATMLPFERQAWWARKKLLPLQFADEMMDRAGDLAQVLVDSGVWPPKVNPKNPLLRTVFAALRLVRAEHIQHALDLVGDKLEDAHRQAIADHDQLTAILTGFKLALEQAEDDGTLLIRH